jgi:hypothetical protein
LIFVKESKNVQRSIWMRPFLTASERGWRRVAVAAP